MFADDDKPKRLNLSDGTPSNTKDASASSLTINPPPYLLDVCAYLRTHEPALWEWFSKTKTQDDNAESVRFELLKSTYRIGPDSSQGIYELALTISRKLGLEIPITFYQAQNPHGLNASICAMCNEAHIILQGPVVERLTAPELGALIGHELGHLLLWRNWDKQFLITELILAALTKDAKAQPAHFETARLFRLHTEIFCDRVSTDLASNESVPISMLIKIATNLEQVDPVNYLQQAHEVREKGELHSEGVTHPETFIRALAIEGWNQASGKRQESAANDLIQEMIQGDMDFDLDLLGQQKLVAITRRLIDVFLTPSWMRTDLTLAHAKAFFDDYQPPPTNHHDEGLFQDANFADEEMKRYLVFIMLDFVAADRDMEHAPIAMALTLAEKLNVKSVFIEIARKELRLRKKQLTEIDEFKTKIIETENSKRLQG